MSLSDYEYESEPPFLTARRLWVYGGLVLTVIALLAGARPLYRVSKAWRAHGLAMEAEQLREQKKFAEAASKTRVALTLSPSEPATLRIAARLSSLSGETDAAIFWRQLLELPAATAEDRQHAVLYALATNQLGFAEEEIKHLLKDAPDDLTALELATQIALKKREPIAVLNFAERLLAKSPGHAFARLNRAQIILLTPNLAKVTLSPAPLRDFEATLLYIPPPQNLSPEDLRADLRALADDTQHGAEAFRLLIVEARRRGAFREALNYSTRLLAGSEWSLGDQLVQLDLLLDANAPDFEPAIQNIIKSSTGKLEPALMLASWLIKNKRAEKLIEIVPVFSADVQGAEAFKLTYSDAFAALARWNDVKNTLKDGSWPQFDLQRKTRLARALREEGRLEEFRAVWRNMIEASESDCNRLRQLLQIAGGWRWIEEQELVLWKVLERFPEENWVSSTLTKLYLESGQTVDLSRVADWLLARDPENAALKNNSAILSLLLSSQVERALRLSREAHEAEPTNPSFTCTYAFALRCTGKNAEALALMETLPVAALSKPNTAAYFALLLRDAGEVTEACAYRAIAASGHLLPQEREFLFSDQNDY